MLVARRALELILAEVDGVAAAVRALWRGSTGTRPWPRGRCSQQAVPTTFGLKAAGWLVAVVDARNGLRGIEPAASLGGAAGTLAPLGERGAEVAGLFAKELGLAEPPLPWHSNRVRVAQLGSALAVAAGVMAKIGLDVALLAQTEVAEVVGARGRRLVDDAAQAQPGRLGARASPARGSCRGCLAC